MNPPRHPIALIIFLAALGPARGEPLPSPCTEDAMIVFDASGSMSGNMEGGIGTLKLRIDEVRNALSEILPAATRFRRVGLITYGPGPSEQCNVKLDLKPTANAATRIMRDLDALSPSGKTPLTTAVARAAEVRRCNRWRGDLWRLALRARQRASRCSRPVDRAHYWFPHEGLFMDRREFDPRCKMPRAGK